MEQYEDRRDAAVSPRHTIGPVIHGGLAPQAGTTWHAEPPFPLDESAQILLGDVHARRGQEVVVSARAGVAVYSLRGQLLASVTVTEPTLTPGVLTDIDGDRKLDIVVGSTQGTDPVVRVYDGRGRLIQSRRLQAADQSVGAVHPIGTLDGDLIVSAADLWIAGPRGVFRLHPPRLGAAWFAAVPTGMLGGTVFNDTTLVSTVTQTNGEYNRIGTAAERRFGFDARPYLLAFDASGEPTSEIALGSVDDADAQESWVLPLTDRTVVAHRHGPTGELLTIDTLSGVVGNRRPISDTVAHLMTARGGAQPLLVLVTTRPGDTGWHMELLDTDLAVMDGWTGRDAAPVPTAVVARVAAGAGAGAGAARTGPYALVADTMSGLTLFGPDGAAEILAEWPTDRQSRACCAAAAVGRERVLVARLADRITVVSVPRNAPRD